jgi:formylglycine-generating enzyme required for sulfatase activity
MARVPVTQRLYREVTHEEPGTPKGDDLPINNVSWHDAVRFCNQLSEMERLAPAYRQKKDDWIWDRSADGYRLPTEAEWEYAARGDDGRQYPWGNEPPSDQLCWSGTGNNLGWRHGPTPVGAFPSGASPFGILDMAGNVMEWCWDRYGSYDAAHVRNPVGAGGGIMARLVHGRPHPDFRGIRRWIQLLREPLRRVRRGGLWISERSSGVRAAHRDSGASTFRGTGHRFGVVGFRCARGPNL